MKRLFCLLSWLLLAWAGTAMSQTGYVLRTTDLKGKPFLDADTLAKLPEKTPVEVVKQQGAWLQVKVGNQQGFVRLLQVRLNVSNTLVAAAAPPAASSVPRPSGSSPTVTTGVRGFDEVALGGAQPNPAELKKMQGFAVTADASRQFAQGTHLASRSVAYYGADGKALKGGNR
jgi:hypothetical protein